MTPLDAPITRADLDHAVDRIMDRMDSLSAKMEDVSLIGVANQIKIDAATLKLGTVHDNAKKLAVDLATHRAQLESGGRVVRVRDVTIAGSTITAMWLVLHLLLKLL